MLLTTGPIFFIMEPKFKLSQSFVNHIRTKHIKQNQTPSPLLNKITPVGFFNTYILQHSILLYINSVASYRSTDIDYYHYLGPVNMEGGCPG